MPAVIWTSRAIADVDQLITFLGQSSSTAAQKAARRIRAAGNSLIKYPRRCPIVQKAEGLRKMNLSIGKNGVVIHYSILETDVIILRVYHGSEDRPT
jgi:plasmid stabilization system protein ParE